MVVERKIFTPLEGETGVTDQAAPVHLRRFYEHSSLSHNTEYSSPNNEERRGGGRSRGRCGGGVGSSTKLSQFLRSVDEVHSDLGRGGGEVDASGAAAAPCMDDSPR